MPTLALGLGASTAIYSVINAVLLRPLTFRDPHRLVRLYEMEAAPGNYRRAGLPGLVSLMTFLSLTFADSSSL